MMTINFEYTEQIARSMYTYTQDQLLVIIRVLQHSILSLHISHMYYHCIIPPSPSHPPPPTPVACGQHGRPPKSLQCHGAGPAAPPGDHCRAGLHGQGDAHPVLQEHSLQASEDHLLQGRGERGPVPAGPTPRAGLHQAGLHEAGGWLPARDHLCGGPEEAPHQTVLLRSK